MAETGQQERADLLRSELLKQAYTKASDVISAQTSVSAARAREIAPSVVDAAAPLIRAEHLHHLTGQTSQQAVALGFAAFGVLALDAVTLAVVAVRGPRWSRPAAALALVAHLAAYGYSRRMQAKTRAAARDRMANGRRHGAA